MDWQVLLNEALKIIIPALATALAGWFAYLGNKLKNAYQEKVNNETAQAVVKDVVQFVEQVYGDIHGKEKLQKAVEQVSTILKSKGINITETEIMMLIESAVYGLNEGLNSNDIKEVINDIKEDTKMIKETVEVNQVEDIVENYNQEKLEG